MELLTQSDIEKSGKVIPNSLIHGECFEAMKFIADESIDLILTDPPYGNTACHWDQRLDLDLLWPAYNRILKPNGVIVLTGSQPYTSVLITSNLKMFQNTWVWNKIAGANFFNLKNKPWKTHEDVIIFSKTAKFTFNPIRVPRTEKSLKRDTKGATRTRYANGHSSHYNFKQTGHKNTLNPDGLKHPIDIITFPIAEKNRYKPMFKHPTKKPVVLFEYLIKTYTNPGYSILDNCAGSFTTAVAAENLKRNYICIEQEEDFCKIGLHRIADNRIELNKPKQLSVL